MRATALFVIILAACTLASGSHAGKYFPPPPSQKTSPPLSAEEVFRRVSPSVVVVESLDTKGSVIGFGSGVVIALGDVITNRHVIEGGISFRVERNGEKFPAKLIAVDPDHDLAALSIAGLDVVGLRVRNSSTLAVGEKVYAIGAPEGLEMTISEGLISGLRDFENGRVIQTSAAISPGSSGGGLFDAQGRLVGITTFYLKEGQNLNFALPAEWIASLPDRAIAEAQATADTPIDVLEVVALEQIMREWPAISHPGPIDLLDLVWLEQKLEQKSEWQGLLKLSLAMVRWYPRDGSAWDRLAEAYRNLDQYQKALEADRKAVEISPEDTVARRNLGLDYGRLQQYEKAVGAWRELVRLKPGDEITWARLGTAYSEVRQYDKAVNAWQKAVRLKPNDTLAWYGLGLACKAAGRRSEVITVYEKLKTLDPTLANKFFKEDVLP